MAKSQRFELLQGKHANHQSGRRYVAGDVVEDHRDLAKAFPGRFRRVDDGALARAPQKAAEEAEAVKVKAIEAEQPADEAADAALEARGANVTENFEGCADLLEVFRRDKLYHVYEAGKTAPLNDEGLPDKKAVKRFVESFLEG